MYPPTEIDYDRAVDVMSDTLFYMGINNTEDPNFSDTAARFTKYLLEFLVPYDPAEVLKHSGGGIAFPGAVDVDTMVVQSNIPFRAVCAHHLLPFVGRAHIGYLPTNGRVVGLSKLTRLVDAVSHSTPSLQEVIGDRIADDLMGCLEPLGAMCVISAEHMCMACRGARAIDVITTTSAVRGVFFSKPEVRSEFFELVKLGQSLKL